MALHASHAALPYPIKNARFSLLVPFLDADGDPTDPTTPDTEISKDDAAAADTAEEIASPKNSVGLLTLSGAETDCSCLSLAFKAASGPKTTLASLYPKVLAIVGSGTLSAGSAVGGTLGTVLLRDVTGCFIRTTGGTGGGGTGGANNQARKIVTYTVSTGAFTVTPNWETTPDNTTTYDVLLPEGMTLSSMNALNPTVNGRTLDVTSTGEAGIDLANVGAPTTALNLSGTTVKTATDVAALLPAALVGGRIDASIGAMAANVLTASAIATDAFTAAKFATDFLTAAKIASDVGTEIGTAVWSAATRVLTANTNLNDPTAAATATAVRSELTTELGRVDAAITSRATPAQVATELATYNGPTNAQLTTALAAADDAVLAAIAGVNAKTTNLPSDPADQSLIIAATDAIIAAIAALNNLSSGQVASALSTYDAPTKAEFDIAVALLATAADMISVKGKTDLLVFTAGRVNANVKAVNDVVLQGTGTALDRWRAV